MEVGTFTGYSALCLARGLGDDGRLLCCDVSEEWTAIARRHWEHAGVAHQIDLRIGPALETLRMLPETPQFDIAFIDADKGGYAGYVARRSCRGPAPRGVILVDNALWSVARVVDADQPTTPTPTAIQAFNDEVAADARVDEVTCCRSATASR